jgi:serine/threonine protein kinase
MLKDVPVESCIRASIPEPPRTTPLAKRFSRKMEPRVGNYELLEKIGGGGMGVVYKAYQLGLNRTVAVKMLLAGPHADPADHERFLREAETLAELNHPNIVGVYELGEHDGQPFFSMEYAEGGSLAAKIGGRPQPVRESAQLVAVLARAVHFAHERGILHRDLKPANVLLTSACGLAGGSDTCPAKPQAAECIPLITDFGLARRLDDAVRLTSTGVVLGTPAYMAPEQASGVMKHLTPAVDTYALGVILYELLTGRPPFQSENPVETILQVLSQDPVPPSQRQAGVPRELEMICLKCLEKNRDDRYATAAELADDLARFLAGEPIVNRGARRREYEYDNRGAVSRGRPTRIRLAKELEGTMRPTVFIVELTTTTGKVCEGYATYEEAQRRVDSLPAECLVGLPLIFEELVDTSQRLVREDGKPLQWHRVPEAQDLPPGPDEPLPLDEGLAECFGEGCRVELPPPETDGLDDDEPLPLM